VGVACLKSAHKIWVAFTVNPKQTPPLCAIELFNRVCFVRIEELEHLVCSVNVLDNLVLSEDRKVEHRYVIDYTLDGQQESLEVIIDSEMLTPEEAQKRVKEAAKPYGKSNVENIKIVTVHSAEVINTDPQTSASE